MMQPFLAVVLQSSESVLMAATLTGLLLSALLDVTFPHTIILQDKARQEEMSPGFLWCFSLSLSILLATALQHRRSVARINCRVWKGQRDKVVGAWIIFKVSGLSLDVSRKLCHE